MIANPRELRQKGYKALFDALGPVDMIRFIQQMSEGQGDYTRDRKKWLGNPSVNEIIQKMKNQDSKEETTNLQATDEENTNAGES
jgi:hypothetical protein